jgi:hypothetical protein
MNHGLVPADWASFFLASTIVGALLAGLIAVGLSAQLVRIAAAPGGVARAAEAIILPLGLVLTGIAGLWPADLVSRVGLAVAIVGAGTWLVVTSLLVLGGGRGPGATLSRRTLPRAIIGQLATLPTIAAGILLVTEVVPGLDFVLVSAGASIVGGLWLGALLLLDLPRP